MIFVYINWFLFAFFFKWRSWEKHSPRYWSCSSLYRFLYNNFSCGKYISSFWKSLCVYRWWSNPGIKREGSSNQTWYSLQEESVWCCYQVDSIDYWLSKMSFVRRLSVERITKETMKCVKAFNKNNKVKIIQIQIFWIHTCDSFSMEKQKKKMW